MGSQTAFKKDDRSFMPLVGTWFEAAHFSFEVVFAHSCVRKTLDTTRLLVGP